MEITFLSASMPIVKAYDLDYHGDLVKEPYPMAYEFTSQTVQVRDMAHFHGYITSNAMLGHCLLKGQIHRPLVAESRAGATNRDDTTEWICLDLDGITGYLNVGSFLASIGIFDTEYVLQWSSSMNIEANSGLRCHVFLKLDKPAHPEVLKNWITGLNLNVPYLKNDLELTKTGASLKWPLDVTTCQNDKLLYIAPPEFRHPNLPDPFPANRISLVPGARKAFTLPYAQIQNKTDLRELTDKVVNELRVKAGMAKRRKSTYKMDGTMEYMANPGASEITGIKHERGFVYFNINGGDSFAYYHPEDQPAFIKNFKGEPTYKTEELFPKYWAELQAKTGNAIPNAQGIIYLAFRDFASSDYYNGIYDSANHYLSLSKAKSESQLRQFMKNHGQALGTTIPDWNLEFNPQNPLTVDPQRKIVNTFTPSEYFRDAHPPYVGAPPPTCAKVISHVLGHDQPTIDHFYNWLAVVAQQLDLTGTAWILHGTQGTGKGILFNQILAPLFGYNNTTSKRMEELESEFTGFMENQFIVFIDEIEAGRSLYHDKINAKLKTLIAEPRISVRRMYSPANVTKNFSNMIFASNKPAPVEVAPDDRRYNVAPYQGTPIQITASEVDTLATELSDLYGYLINLKADRQLARTPLISAARAQLMDVSTTSVDSTANAILNGDFEYLWAQLPASRPDGDLSFSRGTYEKFRALVVSIAASPGTADKLSREDLGTIFEWCVGNMPKTPNKLTSLLKHHRIHMQNVWMNNRTVRGINVSWQIDPQILANMQAEIQQNLV